ncbi:MAG: hypothetical protein R3E48_23290 [Burkholderiaceae bacterium]
MFSHSMPEAPLGKNWAASVATARIEALDAQRNSEQRADGGGKETRYEDPDDDVDAGKARS